MAPKKNKNKSKSNTSPKSDLGSDVRDASAVTLGSRVGSGTDASSPARRRTAQNKSR